MDPNIDKRWNDILQESLQAGDSNYEIWAKHRREYFRKHGNLKTSEFQNSILASLKGRFRGERVFVVGNGPSLNKIDFSLLKGEYSFAVNRINLLFDRVEWRPTFYTVNDWEVGPDNIDDLYQLDPLTHKFVPKRFEGMPGMDGGIVYSSVHARDIGSDFSYDITNGAVMGGTVLTLPIQLCTYMGFSKIYLIGVDCSYSVKDSVKQDGKLIQDNNVKQFLESTEDNDPNHFDSRYFGKGKKWHNPNPDRMIEGFTRMGEHARLAGVELINATVGGRLDTLPRVNFESLFDKKVDSRGAARLGIVVPVYNAEHYIAEAVKSITETVSDCIAIFVDDGSTDKTLKILRSYAADPRVIVITQNNGGAGSARNVGIEKAKELGLTYIAFQDADDFYYPDSMAKLISHLDQNDDIDCVSGFHARVSPGGKFKRSPLSNSSGPESITLESFLGGPSAMLTATVFRFSSVIDVKFPEVRSGEDWLYLAKVRAHINNWVRLPELVTAYRATPQAIKKTSLKYAERMIDTYKDVREIVSSGEASTSEDAKQVEKMVGRLMACGKSEFAKHLMYNNTLNIDLTDFRSKRLKRRVDFWLDHLEVPCADLYRSVAYRAIDEVLG